MLPFPVHPEGELITIGEEGQLGPGVRGLAVLGADAEVYVIFVRAEIPGSGDVGRWLDSLPPGIHIANVLAGNLRGMLIRRGYQMKLDRDGADLWTRKQARMTPMEKLSAETA